MSTPVAPTVPLPYRWEHKRGEQPGHSVGKVDKPLNMLSLRLKLQQQQQVSVKYFTFNKLSSFLHISQILWEPFKACEVHRRSKNQMVKHRLLLAGHGRATSLSPCILMAIRHHPILFCHFSAKLNNLNMYISPFWNILLKAKAHLYLYRQEIHLPTTEKHVCGSNKCITNKKRAIGW